MIVGLEEEAAAAEEERGAVLHDVAGREAVKIALEKPAL
jgi:hypothetical protein